MISYLIAFSLSHRSARPQPTMIKEVRFAPDSALEGDGFEPSVPHTKQPFWLPRSVPQFAFGDKNRLFRAGTDGSNPFPSSGESRANLNFLEATANLASRAAGGGRLLTPA